MRWTLKQIEYLKKNVPQKSGDYGVLAEHFEISSESVRIKCRRLKFPNVRINKQAKRSKPLSEKEAEIKEKLSYEIKYWKSVAENEKKKRYDEEKLIEELKTILSVAKPVKLYSIPDLNGSVSKQEAVLLFSDCQIGEKIHKSETGYRDYNIDIFKQRLDILYDSVLNIIFRHRKDCDVKKLNIFMLGDLVEGWSIFKGQTNRIETDVVEQMFRGQEMIANFIRSLSRYFEEVKVPGIVGNHGRVGWKAENLTHVNWDYVMYRNLKQILNHCENINFDISKKWWDIVDVLGWKFYLEHGDNFKRYMSIPWYGLERGAGRLVRMLQTMNLKFDYMCIGHHHVPFNVDDNNIERFCNGTFSSGNPYAMRELKTSARPTQYLFGVHPKIGITWRYKVRLDGGVK